MALMKKKIVGKDAKGLGRVGMQEGWGGVGP